MARSQSQKRADANYAKKRQRNVISIQTDAQTVETWNRFIKDLELSQPSVLRDLMVLYFRVRANSKDPLFDIFVK